MRAASEPPLRRTPIPGSQGERADLNAPRPGRRLEDDQQHSQGARHLGDAAPAHHRAPYATLDPADEDPVPRAMPAGGPDSFRVIELRRGEGQALQEGAGERPVHLPPPEDPAGWLPNSRVAARFPRVDPQEPSVGLQRSGEPRAGSPELPSELGRAAWVRPAARGLVSRMAHGHGSVVPSPVMTMKFAADERFRLLVGFLTEASTSGSPRKLSKRIRHSAQEANSSGRLRRRLETTSPTPKVSFDLRLMPGSEQRRPAVDQVDHRTAPASSVTRHLSAWRSRE